MDRILAGDLLTKDETNWQLWTDKFGDRKRRDGGAYKQLHEQDKARQAAEEEDQRVGHVLGHMREGGRKFEKTPRLRSWAQPDSCRIYGSLEGNKVQGDFHITARGHGYTEYGLQQHLEHASTFPYLIRAIVSRPFSTTSTRCPYYCTLSARLTTCSPIRFQFLTHHHRTLLWPTFPRTPQPSRQDVRHHRQKLLQIPILPLHRPNHLHPPSSDHNQVRLPRPSHDPTTTDPRHDPKPQT